MINAIPTLYRSIRFRSRLEAKWARFFDLCGWSWSYEPIDLKGWIPDFSIGYKPTLVEVKPFFHLNEFAETIQKIVSSGQRDYTILLGAEPRFREQHSRESELSIGWVLDFYEPNPIPWDLHVGFTDGVGEVGLCPMMGPWINFIHEPPRGIDHPNKWSRVSSDLEETGNQTHGDLSERFISDLLKQKWAQASNDTQWARP